MSRKKFYTKEDVNRKMIRYFRSKEHWRLKYKELSEIHKQLKTKLKNFKALSNKRSIKRIKKLETELKIVTKLYQKFRRRGMKFKPSTHNLFRKDSDKTCENCGLSYGSHFGESCGNGKEFKPSNNLKVTSHSRFQEIYKELLEIMKKNKLKTIEDLENYSLPLTLEDTPEEL